MAKRNSTRARKAAPRKAAAATPGAVSAGKAELQDRIDADLERGYRGTVTDPTPNEDYTVTGAAAGRSPSAADARALAAQAELERE